MDILFVDSSNWYYADLFTLQMFLVFCNSCYRALKCLQLAKYVMIDNRCMYWKNLLLWANLGKPWKKRWWHKQWNMFTFVNTQIKTRAILTVGYLNLVILIPSISLWHKLKKQLGICKCVPFGFLLIIFENNMKMLSAFWIQRLLHSSTYFLQVL